MPVKLDTAKIEQVENINETVVVITKTQITQTLKKHNLKTTDLPTKFHNWEEELSKLTTKEQINSLMAEINQQIENRLKVKKNNKENNNNQQSPSPSLSTKFLVGGIIIGLIIISLGMMMIRKRNKLTRK